MPESASRGCVPAPGGGDYLVWGGLSGPGGSGPGGVPGPGGLVLGVCAWSGGWCAWSRGVCLGGVWSGGLVPGGVPGPGGCAWSGGICLSALWDTTTPPYEQNDKQVQKYYLGHNFVAAGKKYKRQKIINFL